MLPLVDMHVHLLAGLDDGPRTMTDAIEMCRMAVAEGVGACAALAHQSSRWPGVTPGRIRSAVAALAVELRAAGVPLELYPCAEVEVRPDVEAAWLAGELLSVADRGRYLLLEVPDRICVDLRPVARALRAAGVRPIVAHAERSPELLHEPGAAEELIRLGCLIQVSAGGITDPANGRDQRALRGWLRRGVVHLLGSDGHSPLRRRPRMAAAAAKVRRWAGDHVADAVCSSHGTAVLHGLPLRVPTPAPERRWFAWHWAGG